MGNSFSHRFLLLFPTVHPHVHGELSGKTHCCLNVFGSSPRAWGTLSVEFGYASLPRFIPTCMGNSWNTRVVLNADAVHPHVHGELLFPRVLRVTTSGSSPRAWGTHIEPDQYTGALRFIPTCMGNSNVDEFTGNIFPVHPHVHGELLIVRYFSIQPIGSSPRAWGTRSDYQGD